MSRNNKVLKNDSGQMLYFCVLSAKTVSSKALKFNKNNICMHGPAVKMEADLAAAKKSKLGVILFLVYTLVYSGFVFIGLMYPEVMGLHIIGKQNVAIVYGFGLIFLAIVMGFVYNWICTRYEDAANGKETKK